MSAVLRPLERRRSVDSTTAEVAAAVAAVAAAVAAADAAAADAAADALAAAVAAAVAAAEADVEPWGTSCARHRNALPRAQRLSHRPSSCLAWARSCCYRWGA